MTKRIIAGVWIVAVSMAFPSIAGAKGLDDLWDVLDNLSGPGPFNGHLATGKVACWEDGDKKVIRAMSNPDPNDFCLYLEFHRMHSDANPTYPRVNATIPAAGLSVELHRAFEVGGSIGVAVFTTDVAEKVINPIMAPRFVFKPLRLIPKWRNEPRAGFLQMHYRPVIRFGTLTGADFGAPTSTFSSGTEVLWKSGSWIVFDVFEALRTRENPAAP